MSIPVILASQSPSRRRLLANAGIRPTISVSHVDEPAALAAAAADKGTTVAALATPDRVAILSRAKAEAVYRQYRQREAAVDRASGTEVITRPFASAGQESRSSRPIREAIESDRGLAGLAQGPILIGCDSLFEINGQVHGKPHDAAVAAQRLKAMCGSVGTLYTGHTVIDMASGASLTRVSAARLHFSDYSDAEIDRYIATREPLEVAGSFTLEGIGGAFIDSIEGDPHGIIGLSTPLVRSMTTEMGFFWPDLWNCAGVTDASASSEETASVSLPTEFVSQPGDGWVDCACGQKHWGLNGAAGVLLARRDAATGDITDVVLQHRCGWSVEGGTWGVPGGALAQGENPCEGALRESFEEAGITADDVDIVGACTEDHGPWKYTTLLALERRGHRVRPRANDDESLSVEWIPVKDVAHHQLLSYFAADWPAYSQRLSEISHAL